MLSHDGAGLITTYEALPAVKEQRRFQPRRRSVRPRSASVKPSREQSTLTQFDFSSTPSGLGDHASNTTDDDDDEFEEPRPKKRQRKIKQEGRDARQKTLTQIDRSGSHTTLTKRQFDSQGWQVWDDSDAEESRHGLERDRHCQPSSPLALGQAGAPPGPAEIPESSQTGCGLSPETGRALMPQMRRPALVFHTPTKPRFADEIPSSQTPPSTKESPHERKSGYDAHQRSPLKEKSVNALLHRPCSSPPETMKILERARFARRKMAERQHLAESVSVLDQIPDDEDAFLEDTLDDPADHDLVSNGHIVRTPGHRSKTQVVIQDSQSEALSPCEDPEAPASDVHASLSVRKWPVSQPHTYDPAYDALARDASRFGWTQSSDHDRARQLWCDLSDDDDLDRGCLMRPEHPVDRSSDAEDRHPADPTPTPPQVRTHTPPQSAAGCRKSSSQLQRSTLPDHSGETAGVGAEAVPKTRQMPSSPPTPRPSQATTVVPSQYHQSARNASCSHRSHARRSSQLARSSIGLTLATESSLWTSPGRNEQLASSSPLQRPSWATQDSAAFTQSSSRRRGSKESEPTPTKLERLLDFSLPPPPSLSSSRRNTPSSSS